MMTEDLFEAAECPLPEITLDERVTRVRVTLQSLLAAHTPLVVLYSAGKDSSAVALLTLDAARQAKLAGLSPLVVVCSGDTLTESPEVDRLRRVELSRMEHYASQHRFELLVVVAQPSLLASTQCRLLTGRGLPAFPGGNNDCAVSLKVTPMRVARRRLFAELADRGLPEPVSLLGTRLDESQRRALNMTLRGERADVPVRNKDGDLVLSPLANWPTDTLWEFLGYVQAGEFGLEPYTPLAELLRLYADAGGTSCAVVSDALLEAQAGARQGRCSTRTGCWTCTKVTDRSLHTLAQTEGYGYLTPLVRFTDLLRATRYDWSRRNWIGRTVRDGWILCQPDTYSPRFIRELTRYLLTIDEDERRRASLARERPRFEALTPEMIVTLDYLQNLTGIAGPFQVLADYAAVQQGIRWDVPDVPEVPATPLPEPRFLHVGSQWEALGSTLGGLRDDYFEALTELAPCQPELRTLPNGRVVWDLPTSKGFEVDEEVASFVLCEFLPELLAKRKAWRHNPQGATLGWRWYIGLGTPTLDHSHLRMHDEIARRTEWKFRAGLGFDAKQEDVLARSVRFAELPEEARRIWRAKATSDGCQLDLEQEPA